MKNKTLTTIVPIITVLIAAGGSLAGIYFQDQLSDIKKDSLIRDTHNFYATEKVTFCLNEKLTPCTDEMISIHNNTNSAQFQLKTTEQLTNEAIEQYSLLN